VAFSPLADAAVFEGSFSGVATDSRIGGPGPDPQNFDGEAVTGTFRVDTASLPDVIWNTPTSGVSVFPLGALQVTFVAAGQTLVFGTSDGGSLINVDLTADGPLIGLGAGVLYPYFNASLVLAGPLMDGMDIRSLHPGPIDLSRSSASFFGSREFGANVELTSVSFAALAVPEPQSWALMLCGLGVVGWRFRKRSGQVSSGSRVDEMRHRPSRALSSPRELRCVCWAGVGL
jgi:hypothetical protein